MGEEGKSDKRSGVDASGTRRAFLASAAACCAASAAAAGAEPDRVVIPGVDRSRAREPMYEGVRIVLSHMGERYSPAYIQGISGGAFRIAGICPCAANCSLQMDTPNLIKLLGYEYEQHILGWTGDVDDAKRNMVALIPRIKESIRAGRPVLLWYAFADTAYEVVVGYDDKKGVFLGRHMHQGPRDGLAEAKQTRAEEAASVCPAFGAIFIGKKTGKLNRRAAEIAALRAGVLRRMGAVVPARRREEIAGRRLLPPRLRLDPPARRAVRQGDCGAAREGFRASAPCCARVRRRGRRARRSRAADRLAVS